jgi:membrane-bound lytic murein transglycosylase D
MKRFIKQLWLLSAIVIVLFAGSGSANTVKHPRTTAHKTVLHKTTTHKTSAHKTKAHKTTKHKTNVHKTTTHKSHTHPYTTLSQNFYRPVAYYGDFLKPGELEPAVEFWRKIFVHWTRSEIVIHDDRYMDVIYEVSLLPGYVGEGLTDEQKDIVSQRRDFWKNQLATLEIKLLYNTPLNASDQQIIAKLKSSNRPLNELLVGAAGRVHTQRGTRERFKRGLEISSHYIRQFKKIFRDANLPEDLAYLPHVESSFQPSARSTAGAVGMWQFTKLAGKRFIPAGNRVDRRLDPFASASGAANYLSFAYDKLGDWPSAITSYNHGISGMRRAQEQVGFDFARIVRSYESPSFGFASRNFYAEFLAVREIANNPTQFFPEGVQYEVSARE